MPAAVELVSDAQEWLRHLFADCEGWVSLFSLDRTDGTQHVDWAPAVALDQAAGIAAQRAPRCCVWFGVATRRQRLEGKRRGGADDCLHIPALWADIDVEGPNHKGGHPLPRSVEAAAELVNSFPLPPTAVVRSGGGLQGWWFLQEPLTVDDKTLGLLRAWGTTWVELARRRSWHVDNVFDAARIMRLPGTWNRKNTPAAVTAKAVWERRYNPEDFEPHLLEAPAPPDPGPARIPYIGPERPGDAFNAVRNGGDILARAGFALGRRHSGEEHWTRPDKEVKDGASATVYPDGHTTIWSDTVRKRYPLVELRRPYDPFGLYTMLFHDGDFTASSDALAAEGYGTKARADDDLSWIPATAWPAPGAAINGATPPTEPEPQPDPYLQRAVLVERARRQARRIVDLEETEATITLQPAEPDPDIHQLFLQPEPDYRWIIPNLLERGDRLILTGPEGGGKSTLLRQVAVTTAAGIHPFTEDDIDPLRVLYIDLENSRRHTLRQFAPLVAQAPGRIATRHLTPVVRPEGLDLLAATDHTWLAQRLDVNQPDLLVIGPLYKLALGDPTSEEIARHVAFVLDDLRATYDVAMLIEAHQPHRSNGHRPDRPYGASLWMRWPEFGIALTGGFLRHWRGARDERDWPVVLRRGGAWPWMTGTVAGANFAALMAACLEAGEMLSERELARQTGIPKTTIHRAIDANRTQWNGLAEQLGGEAEE